MEAPLSSVKTYLSPRTCSAQRDDLVVLPGLEHGGDGGGGLGVEALRTLGLRRRGKALRAGGKDGQGDKCAGKGGERLLHVFSPERP